MLNTLSAAKNIATVVVLGKKLTMIDHECEVHKVINN